MHASAEDQSSGHERYESINVADDKTTATGPQGPDNSSQSAPPATSAGKGAASDEFGGGTEEEPSRVAEAIDQDSDIAEAHPSEERGPAVGKPTGPVPPVPAPPTGRLAPGGLAALVADYLAGHPEVEFTPTELSRLLGGRSSGAIYNALAKMTVGGTALQTCQSPRRFRHADAKPA